MNNEDFSKAKEFENQGKFALAAKEYEHTIELGIGDQAEAHQRRGRSLARLGRYEEALDECQKALALDPELPLAHAVLGDVYIQQARYDLAEEEYLTSLRLKPNNVAALGNLAYIYSKQENYEKAIAMCKKGLRYQPQHPKLRIALAELYRSQSRFREAIEQLNKVRKAKPRFPRVYAFYAAVIVDAVPHYLRLNPAVGAAILVGSILLAPFGPLFLSLPVGVVLSAFVLVSAFVYLWFYNSRYKGKGFVILQVLVFYLLLCAVYWGIVYIRNFR